MKITIFDTLGISLLGLAVVFVVLVLLMVIIVIMTSIMRTVAKNPLPAAAPAVTAAPPAPGSCGEVSVFDVPDRTAAMVMAIVADELNMPLNELRFVSIKEAEEK